MSSKSASRAKPKSRHKPPAPPTARPPTVIVAVPSPYTPGTIDRPERVVDTIWTMWRSGRITKAQYATAQVYQLAYETVHGSGVQSIDLERTGGTVCAWQRSPSRFTLRSAEIIREADAVLNSLQEAPRALIIARMVIGQGHTIKAAAGAVRPSWWHLKPSRSMCDEASRQLRVGLDAIERVCAL